VAKIQAVVQEKMSKQSYMGVVWWGVVWCGVEWCGVVWSCVVG